MMVPAHIRNTGAVMLNHLKAFIEALSDAGYAPANGREINITEKWINYQLAGDPPGKKKGRCVLNVVNDQFAYGQYGDWRTGETFSWHTKARRGMPAEDKHRFRLHQQDAQAQHEREQTRNNERAARDAEALWDGATPAPRDHAYLIRKQAAPYDLKIDTTGNLIVPLYDVYGRIWNTERISPDGEKKTQWQGRVKGVFASLPMPMLDESDGPLCVVEGFATGDAVYRATGLPVVIARNAGNLYPVVKALREKFPQRPIAICADNDQFKLQDNPKLINAGVVKAKEAADAFRAEVVWPDVPADDPLKRTDWNDMILTEGVDYVRDKIAALPCVAAAIRPPPPTDTSRDPDRAEYVQRFGGGGVHIPDWRAQLLVSDKGYLKPGSLHNLNLYLKHHDALRGVFVFNEFANNVTLARCPPWESEKEFDPHRLTDHDNTMATAFLEGFGFQSDTGKVAKAIQTAARFNRFHPARDYFSKLQWDGVNRLEAWLSSYMKCQEPDEYLSIIGKKWLIAAVKRVFEPGCKFDSVLVIEGKQGSFKSTSLKKLATFGDDTKIEYFTDGVTIADIQTKDAVMKTQGCLIVELSELSGFGQKTDEEIKRWITLQFDDVRMPYAREIERLNRQFILAATTNKNDYLQDATGNRRYWPISINGKIDLAKIEEDKDQLWAEAVFLYQAKYPVYADDDEEIIIQKEREKRMSHDPWSDSVNTAISALNDHFKTSDIMDQMGLGLKEKDARTARRICSILRLQGFENRVTWHGGKTERVWFKKVEEQEILF